MEKICQHFNVFGLVPVTLPVVSFRVNPCAEDRFYGALQIMVIPYPLMYCCALINREIDRTIPLRISTGLLGWPYTTILTFLEKHEKVIFLEKHVLFCLVV